MKQSTNFILALLVCATTASSLPQERELKKSAVPKAVLDAFAKAYPNAKANEFSTETENGKTMYEIESTDGKTKRDITFTADGTLMATEETIASKDLPEAVRASLKKDFEKATITRCEKITEGASTMYEVAMKSGKKKSEIVFNADGSVKKK
jgi:uncharacterized membrane protein YkoI